MSFFFDFTEDFVGYSARVKCVALHSTEPWLACSLHSGRVYLYDLEAHKILWDRDLLDHPARTVKFIERENLIICGSDDGMLHVYDYRRNRRVKRWTAHADYIREVVVHPTLPFVLSCSDDQVIRLWSWEIDWGLVDVFKGHSHYTQLEYGALILTDTSLEYARCDGSRK
mgnify:CR=1 FL=1